MDLRLATLDDSRTVWEINNAPTVRAQSLSTSDIPWNAHVPWYERKLRDENALVFVGVEAGRIVGVVRFQRDGGSAVIGVAVAPTEQGHGYGVELITLGTRAAQRHWPDNPIFAVIRLGNDRSVRAFLKAGYVLTEREANVARYVAVRL